MPARIHRDALRRAPRVVQNARVWLVAGMRVIVTPLLSDLTAFYA
jgi:hypothetical protein